MLRLLPTKWLLTRGRKLRESGKPARALQYAEICVERLERAEPIQTSRRIKPQSTLAYSHYFLGRVLLDVGQFQQAIDHLFMGYVASKKDPVAISALASGLLELKCYDQDVRDVLLDYIDKPPFGETPEQFEGNLLTLKRFVQPSPSARSRLHILLDWNQGIVDRCPKIAWASYHLAMIAAEQGKWRKATQHAWDAFEADHADASAWALWQYSLAQRGQFGELALREPVSLCAAISRPVLLLRAYTMRIACEANEACRYFTAAHRQEALQGDMLVHFIESLINAGETRKARTLLVGLKNATDLRIELLRGICAASEEQGLHHLHPLIETSPFASQALARILSLGAKKPTLDNLKTALADIPVQHMDRLYHLVRSNTELICGRFANAVSSLRAIKDPSPQVICQMQSALRHQLGLHYSRGEDNWILSLVQNGLPPEAVTEEILLIITSAMVRFIRGGLEQKEHHRQNSAKTIEAVLQAMPELAAQEEVLLAVGLLFSSTSRFTEAHRMLSKAQLFGKFDIEGCIQLIRCALKIEDWDTFHKLLDKIKGQDKRLSLIEAAAAALKKQWREALDHLYLSGKWFEVAPQVAALEFLCGRNMLDSELPDCDYLSYYKDLQKAQRGGIWDELRWVTQERPNHQLTVWGNRLHGWMQLREAQTRLTKGDVRNALGAINNAVDLWPDASGPANLFQMLRPLMLPWFLETEDRVSVAQTILALQDGQHPNPEHAHRMALFHLSEGELMTRKGQWKEAERNGVFAIGFVGSVLTNDIYIRNWIRSRLAVIHANFEGLQESFVNNVVAQIRSCFFRWHNCIADPVGQGMIGLLEPMLHAEFEGIKSLNTAGGIEECDSTKIRLGLGPVATALYGREKDVATITANLRVQIAKDADKDDLGGLLKLFMRLIDYDGEEANAIEGRLIRLERLFSWMRVATVHADANQFDMALEQLRSGEIPSCCPNESVTGQVENFAKVNAAFAIKGGETLLENARRRFEIDLLIKIGEREISSINGSLADGILRWREALELSTPEDQTAELICKSALGRVAALTEKKREAEGIPLLEMVNVFCTHDEIHGKLADLHETVAIRLINEEDDWEGGVKGLRTARRYNPHSPNIDHNLVKALRTRAGQIYEENLHLAIQLIEEALELARVNHKRDQHHSEFKGMVERLQKDLHDLMVLMNIASGGQYAQHTHLNAQEYMALSLMHAQAGRMEEALHNLHIALALNPHDTEL